MLQPFRLLIIGDRRNEFPSRHALPGYASKRNRYHRSLPCFPAFCWCAIPTSHHISNDFSLVYITFL